MTTVQTSHPHQLHFVSDPWQDPAVEHGSCYIRRRDYRQANLQQHLRYIDHIFEQQQESATFDTYECAGELGVYSSVGQLP